MSGANYIKKALVAALCEHPDAEKYRNLAFSGDNLTQTLEAMAGQQQMLTKADFLALDDAGKCLLDCPGAWKNFARIAETARANGDRFTFDDFITPIAGDRTLLDSAVAHGGLSNIFTFEIWEGRFDDMERLWHRVPVPNRKEIFKDGMTAPQLKRRLFAAEGKTTPEDRMLKAGLLPDDIRTALSAKGELAPVVAKLEAAGDWLRKEYVLLPNASGDMCFDNASAWGRYQDVVAEMTAHGERFEVNDFLKQVSYAKNMLARAAEYQSLSKVFTPAHWQDRLEDMLQLWSCVLPGWTAAMGARDFDASYAEAENLTYAPQFAARPLTGKQDLFTPLNNVGEPVLAIGLRAVWDNFALITEKLDAIGQPLTIADLRASTGEMGNTGLLAGAKFDRFSAIVDLAKERGEKLTVKDFIAEDIHGNTLINVLAEKNQLALAFAPELWVGRVKEMKDLWWNVALAYRGQVDFTDAEINAKRATLASKKPGNSAFKPKK